MGGGHAGARGTPDDDDRNAPLAGGVELGGGGVAATVLRNDQVDATTQALLRWGVNVEEEFIIVYDASTGFRVLNRA